MAEVWRIRTAEDLKYGIYEINTATKKVKSGIKWIAWSKVGWSKQDPNAADGDMADQ